MSSVYKWADGSKHKIKAQVAGEELKRIEDKYGGIEPAKVVDESREESTVLHECFEWNDLVAAEAYREVQAKELIRHVTVVYEQEEGEEPQTIEIRAFHSIINSEEQRRYISTECIMSNEDYEAQIIQEAYKELQSFKRKYSNIRLFAQVFEAIENTEI